MNPTERTFPEFRNSQEAFQDAIKQGKLSDNPQDENYAGHFMYMMTQDSIDQFKNINTREYLK